MTNTAIVAVVFGAIALVAFAALIWTSRDPLAHRGEAAEGHADELPGADDQCALTLPRPLETVPAAPDPNLIDREREMAGTTAARLAGRLDLRSNR